ALSQLVWRGPIGLVEPFEVFSSCLGAGLLPKNVELAASNLTAQAQRENLLSVALNHGAAGFITSCVSQFAEGEFVHAGCTLRFILDWAWGKVAQVKDSLDKLCVPLYDCSGMPLEQQGLQLFHQHQLQLTNLQTIVQVLMTNSGPSTSQGLGDLDMKFRVVTLINQFYQAVSWCLSNNLLPEFDEAESPPSGQYCYPASVLGHEYQTRRQQISRLHSDIQETDLLMIDGMIDEEAAAVRALWSKQGGAGLYPPKSLHALLTIYLLENISLASKHSLVAYFFLDLISMMGEKDQNLVDRLSRFCQAIHLPQSRTRMIQGFWLLDHKDFEEAVLLLLDPMLLEEMLPWQHNRIIKAFLYQGEEKIALKFLRVKKPPLVTPEDVRLHLTVLLANGLISEAFEYQKVCSNNERDNDNLLGHLFTACQQTKTIDRLLQLPLTDGEERQLLQYLRDSKETRNMEILMLHFLQRARYVEAIRLNEKLGQTLLHESDPKTRERAAARNSIVDCYSKVLPSVQRKLTFGNDHRPKKTMHLTRREIQRPRPLSTVVHHNNNQKVISNAMLINAVLEKIGETRPPPEQTPVRNRPQPSDAALGPFICTPVTPRAKSNLISEDTEIVYPSIQRDTRTEERSRTVSPVKKMVTGLMPQTPLASPVTAKNQNVNRILSTEALSLLQTPPVKRRTPPTLKKLTSLQHTPQSILKVRQVVKRSPSPSPLQQDQPQTIKRLSFLNADLALETPPRYQRKKVEVRKTKVKDTPKHLRFAGLSTPSPEPSPPKLPSPRRTRRRSPTPER
ncbi:protein ELYS, partial [Lingula anatina]|uniref:Protein ELYS n=1 Tax=Lingula anatina TaxID=7574 RepID=A0A1S3I6L8_LINAN